MECKDPCSSSFVNTPTESTLYVRKDGEKSLIVVLYVDDLLITGPNEQEIEEYTDLGHLHYYLSINSLQLRREFSWVNESTSRSSYNYLGFEECKPISTPVEVGFQILILRQRRMNKCTLIQASHRLFDIFVQHMTWHSICWQLLLPTRK